MSLSNCKSYITKFILLNTNLMRKKDNLSVCFQNVPNLKPRLVAVSKTKPKELLFTAYDCGQRHFGENYVQELVDKSNDPEVIYEINYLVLN